MLKPGIYPASVTPFDSAGDVDEVAVSQLLARLEAMGCQGVLLAGTNGEGASLSAVERRDLARISVQSAGTLDVILGLATSSLPEAIWLTEQAAKAGVKAVLVNPPCLYRGAEWSGINHWFQQFAIASALPWMFYNFPKVFHYSLDQENLLRLRELPNFLGVKDSSGEVANIAAYRALLGQQNRLFVGDERLLPSALDAGWSGSVSGASNLIGAWLVEWWRLRESGDTDGAEVKWNLLLPSLDAIRTSRQPATNKAVLALWKIIQNQAPRAPLEAVAAEPVAGILNHDLGLR